MTSHWKSNSSIRNTAASICSQSLTFRSFLNLQWFVDVFSQTAFRRGYDLVVLGKTKGLKSLKVHFFPGFCRELKSFIPKKRFPCCLVANLEAGMPSFKAGDTLFFAAPDRAALLVTLAPILFCDLMFCAFACWRAIEKSNNYQKHLFFEWLRSLRLIALFVRRFPSATWYFQKIRAWNLKRDDFNKKGHVLLQGSMFTIQVSGSCSQSRSVWCDCPTKIPTWFGVSFEFPLSNNEALGEYSQCILKYRLSLVVDYFKNLEWEGILQRICLSKDCQI